MKNVSKYMLNTALCILKFVVSIIFLQQVFSISLSGFESRVIVDSLFIGSFAMLAECITLILTFKVGILKNYMKIVTALDSLYLMCSILYSMFLLAIIYEGETWKEYVILLSFAMLLSIFRVFMYTIYRSRLKGIIGVHKKSFFATPLTTSLVITGILSFLFLYFFI